MPHFGDGRGERRRFHPTAIDDEPFGEVDQMRRRVAPRAVPGRTERRVEHRRHRAFAVGAGDVNRAKGTLGVIQAVHERPDVLEAELDPDLLEAEEVGERVGHLARS